MAGRGAFTRVHALRASVCARGWGEACRYTDVAASVKKRENECVAKKQLTLRVGGPAPA